MVSIAVLNQLNCLKEMPKNPSNHFFYLSLKHATIDLGFKNFSDAVKHEAILNCVNNEWCSFMCLLGLSSVLKSQIHSFYPDIGDLMYKQLFNQVIVPFMQNTQQKCFRILFCGIEPFGSKNRKLFNQIILHHY